MVSAIDICHRVDECKDIIDKSIALAAYYKQIEDNETVQRFYEVRLRAWRRIGRLFTAVDMSNCATISAKIRAIRDSFDKGAMRGISDSRILEILKLSALSDSDFEYAIGCELNTGSISEVLRNTPAFQEEVRKNLERREPTPEQTAENHRRSAAAFAQMELEHRHITELEQASEDAMKEVGLTLERKDRASMKSVVFLIKSDVHAVMRKAAFDQKITMQEVLRRGLKMWLVAHGHAFPDH
jgi:hypothetical protein